MKLSDYENKVFDFFQGSRIVEFLHPHHFYTWILFFIGAFFLYGKVKKTMKEFFSGLLDILCSFGVLSKRFLSRHSGKILIIFIIIAISFPVVGCGHYFKEKADAAAIYNAKLPDSVPDGFVVHTMKHSEYATRGDMYYGRCGCSPFNRNEWQVYKYNSLSEYNHFCNGHEIMEWAVAKQ